MWDHAVSTCTQACPCVYLRACVNVFLPVCLLTCKRVLKHFCACAHVNTCVSPMCLCMYPHRCAHMPSDLAMPDPRDFPTPPSLPAQHCCISNPGKSLAPGDFLSPPAMTPALLGSPPGQRSRAFKEPGCSGGNSSWLLAGLWAVPREVSSAFWSGSSFLGGDPWLPGTGAGTTRVGTSGGWFCRLHQLRDSTAKFRQNWVLNVIHGAAGV